MRSPVIQAVVCARRVASALRSEVRARLGAHVAETPNDGRAAVWRAADTEAAG